MVISALWKKKEKNISPLSDVVKSALKIHDYIFFITHSCVVTVCSVFFFV